MIFDGLLLMMDKIVIFNLNLTELKRIIQEIGRWKKKWKYEGIGPYKDLRGKKKIKRLDGQIRKVWK